MLQKSSIALICKLSLFFSLQLPEASPSSERLASFPGFEEDHRRLQRKLPAAGTDGEQSYEAETLGPDSRVNWSHI